MNDGHRGKLKIKNVKCKKTLCKGVSRKGAKEAKALRKLSFASFEFSLRLA